MESVNDKWRILREEKMKGKEEFDLRMSGVYLREIRNWLRLIGIMVMLGILSVLVAV